MNGPLVCFHGHKLYVADEIPDRQQLICPYCGSLRRLSRNQVNNTPEAFAVTVVPVTGTDLSGVGLNVRLTEPDKSAAPSARTELLNPDSGARTAAPQADAEPIAGVARSTDDHGDTPGRTNSDLPTKPMPQTRFPKPPRVPGYEVMEEVGRGGMGVVYQAYDEKHGRDVALKTLQRMGPDDIVRFKQEFRALSDIAHPNLASLYELLSDGRTWCFTMELLTGVEFLDYVWSEFDSLTPDPRRTARAEIPDQAPRLSPRRINRLFESVKQLAVGLNELHRVGKLHSDIKPSNVLVTAEGRVVLLDFGLIAEITKDEQGRLPRMIQGTPHYMSPEQAACGPLSGASDMYAVGVMLYEVLTGQLPIRDVNARIMLRKQYEIPIAPIKRQPKTPPELNELCMSLLEINPRNRPSIADLLRAVDAEQTALDMAAFQPAAATRSAGLVGREPHLRILNQMFSEVVDGATRSVFVQGLSGMGKSVLIQTFLHELKEQKQALVLEGRCYEQESVPFKALDDLIDSLMLYLGTLDDAKLKQLLPGDIRPLQTLFPVLEQLPTGDRADRASIENADQQELRQRGMSALRELLTRLSEQQTIVLYIDDLQWGDEDSADLLVDLLRPPNGPRLLFLGSYRREDISASPSLLALASACSRGPHRPHRRELQVEQLTPEDAARLALMLLPASRGQTRQLAERIGHESGGSPFFVWELAQHVQQDGEASTGTLELDEVIWSRVRRLPAETRRLLEVFAVAGRPMRASEAYQAVDEVAHGPGLLAQLRTSNLVRTTEHEYNTIVEIYHDRIRESVVNHLASARIRGHHLRLALVIEQASGISLAGLQAHLDSTPAFAEPGSSLPLDKRQWQRVFDIADYFDAADKPERALPYALTAAERAWGQNAFDVAEQQFEIARRGAVAASDAMRFRIAEGLGDVLMIRGHYDRANQHFQTARSLAHDNMTLARINGKRGYLCFKKGDMLESARHFEQALTELGTPPPVGQLRQTAALVREIGLQVLHTWFPQLLVGRRKDDTERCRKDLFRARIHDGLGYPYWFTKGPIPALWTHLRHMNLAERYPPAPELGRAWAMHAIMMTAVPLAARGVRYAEKAYQIHGSLGDRLGQGKARSFQTFSLLTLGRFREGVTSGREAVQLLEQAGDVWEGNMARIILSQPLYFLGDLRNAHLEARRAYETGVETGDHSAIAIALYFWVTNAPHKIPEGAIQAERERVREDPLSRAAVIQARGLELLLREDDPAAAAVFIQESLNLARTLGIRNPAIFCGVTWKATALRMVADRAAAGPARDAALRAARQAVRDALRITRKYLTCRARALRERAELAVLEDREKQAQQYFEASLQVAGQQEAACELALTQIAQGQAGLRFGWPDAEQVLATGRAAIQRITDFGDV